MDSNGISSHFSIGDFELSSPGAIVHGLARNAKFQAVSRIRSFF